MDIFVFTRMISTCNHVDQTYSVVTIQEIRQSGYVWYDSHKFGDRQTAGLRGAGVRDE